MELIVKSFSLLNLKDNKIYLPGDFNINLLRNGNHILNRKGIAGFQGPVHTLTNKHQKCCQIFSLQLLITCPTRVACNIEPMVSPSKVVVACNIFLKDTNEILFNATKNCSIF